MALFVLMVKLNELVTIILIRRTTMNKQEFINYISDKNNCTKTEAEKIINTFTDAVMSSVGEGKEILLIGFGQFCITKVPAKTGRNPQTGKSLQISAHNRVRFKVGQKLKDSCNK